MVPLWRTVYDEMIPPLGIVLVPNSPTTTTRRRAAAWYSSTTICSCLWELSVRGLVDDDGIPVVLVLFSDISHDSH